MVSTDSLASVASDAGTHRDDATNLRSRRMPSTIVQVWNVGKDVVAEEEVRLGPSATSRGRASR